MDTDKWKKEMFYIINSQPIKLKENSIGFKKDGKLHNVEFPACVITKGNICDIYYCLDGKFHREDDKPARIYYKNGILSTVSFYINGKLHRDNGPAIIMYYGKLIIKKRMVLSW